MGSSQRMSKSSQLHMPSLPLPTFNNTQSPLATQNHNSKPTQLGLVIRLQSQFNRPLHPTAHNKPQTTNHKPQTKNSHKIKHPYYSPKSPQLPQIPPIASPEASQPVPPRPIFLLASSLSIPMAAKHFLFDAPSQCNKLLSDLQIPPSSTTSPLSLPSIFSWR